MAKKKEDGGYMAGPVAMPKTRDYVVVELRHDSQIAYSARGFGAPAAKEKDSRSLNSILEGFKIKKITSHFQMSTAAVNKRVTAAPMSLKQKVTAEFAHSGFVQVQPNQDKDCESLVRRLNQSKAVWKAYVAPKPVPAALATGTSTASRNFEPAQGYLMSPPDGIGAMSIWGAKGARGEKVIICDIEGNWNRTHEDLPKGIKLIGGTPINDIGWRNHGTAVLGEFISQPNGFGTVGISHMARAAVQSAVIGGVFNTAGAIRNAALKLGKGDVILIELHAIGPQGKYVAMQYWLDVFSAIRDAVDKGITVVEAAGNGGENFNISAYNGTGLQKDSGAIVVGAGVPPTNYHDYFGDSWPGGRYGKVMHGVPRSRAWFSNYGRIVNVHGWGWHVTTLGYGDAQGGKSENRWYTHRFSGTSSASPIVTGAVACIQGRSKVVRGKPYTPAEVRKLLIATGTPQVAGPGAPLTQHIGPLPNLEKAVRLIRR